MSNYADLIWENLSTEYLDLILAAANLADKGHQGIVLVGGVVRDLLMGRPIRELDLMLDPPVRPLVEELAQISSAQLVSHELFHTYTLHLPSGLKLDVVTAREETYRSPAALPDVFPSTISEDLKRRDFSTNAMALWLNKDRYGELLDPFGGFTDLKKRSLRVLHPLSFVDDPTRIYRAARFAGRFNFKLEEETEKFLLKAVSAGIPGFLSPVRRRHEFELILKEDNPVPALKLLKEWNALRFIHPDWDLKPDHIKTLNELVPSHAMDVLAYRLVLWLKPWGQEAAKVMLTDLSFERHVKKKILMELGL